MKLTIRHREGDPEHGPLCCPLEVLLDDKLLTGVTAVRFDLKADAVAVATVQLQFYPSQFELENLQVQAVKERYETL